jgi:hypothetical protein
MVIMAALLLLLFLFYHANAKISSQQHNNTIKKSIAGPTKFYVYIRQVAGSRGCWMASTVLLIKERDRLEGEGYADGQTVSMITAGRQGQK